MTRLLPFVVALTFATPSFGQLGRLCPDGRPAPCLSPTLTPSLPAVPSAPVPTRIIQLADPPPVAAPVQLAAIAGDATDGDVPRLRREAAGLLERIRLQGFLVAIQGFSTLLSPLSPSSSSAEDEMREMRSLLGEYLRVLREIESLTIGDAAASDNFRIRNSQVRVDGRANNAIDMDLSTVYSVNRRNTTVHVNEPNPPQACRTETIYEAHIENVVLDAGFDERGNPIKRQGMDVVRRPKQVTVCQ